MIDSTIVIWKISETIERLGLVPDEVLFAMFLHSYWRNKEALYGRR
jgi:hypothetical protein